MPNTAVSSVRGDNSAGPKGHAPPEGESAMRKVAAITAIIIGTIMAVAGVVTWVVVGNTLSGQNIVVSADADCLAGDDVNGPFSAYCQAMVINKHTMGITCLLYTSPSPRDGLLSR